MTVLEFLLVAVSFFFVGVVSMYLVTKQKRKKESCGDLLVFQDPDDGPYFFLELAVVPEDVIQKEYISLKVTPR